MHLAKSGQKICTLVVRRRCNEAYDAGEQQLKRVSLV
jgi:hypothetical protein